MKNGKCLKCGSSNVYKHESGVLYSEESLPSIVLSTNSKIGWNYFNYDSYVCTDCGYFENYIRTEEDFGGKSMFEIVEEDPEWEKI